MQLYQFATKAGLSTSAWLSFAHLVDNDSHLHHAEPCDVGLIRESRQYRRGVGSGSPCAQCWRDTTLPVTPWTKLRDDSVVRQQLDYSCGAAALATLLSHYYGEPTTERQVLEQQTEPKPATFSTLAELASAFGYQARGYALSLDTLNVARRACHFFRKQLQVLDAVADGESSLLVLSISASYRLNLKRSDGVATIRPGNLLAINPQLGFAVNESVTLLGGLLWQLQQGGSASDRCCTQRSELDIRRATKRTGKST